MAISLKDIGAKIKDFLTNFLPKDETVTIYGRNHPSYQQQPSPSLSPTPTPTPTPTPDSNYQHHLPVSYPGMGEVPQSIFYKDRGGNRQSFNLAQSLMENFDDIKQATAAGEMLAHGHEQTYMPQEIERLGHDNWNYGENPRFEVIADSLQENGTYDKGLMRMNTGTLDDMLSRDFWKRKLGNRGVSSWEDLDNPEKSIRAARTRLEYGNWEDGAITEKPKWFPWYNAPLKRRTGDY